VPTSRARGPLRNELRVDFLPERRLDSPRIVRYELLNLPWIGHSVKLASPAGIDDELVPWLAEAYELKR